MRIEVSAKMIAEGKVGSCGLCPVALAVNAVLRDGFHSVIGCRSYTIRGGALNRLQDGWLPAEAAEFINDFDFHRPARPFTFDLPIDQYCR